MCFIVNSMQWVSFVKFAIYFTLRCVQCVLLFEVFSFCCCMQCAVYFLECSVFHCFKWEIFTTLCSAHCVVCSLYYCVQKKFCNCTIAYPACYYFLSATFAMYSVQYIVQSVYCALCSAQSAVCTEV